MVLEVGPLRLPLPIKTDGKGFVEWLYLDEDFRITRVGVAFREWCCILDGGAPWFALWRCLAPPLALT